MFSNWSNEIESSLIQCSAYCVALYEFDGSLIFANRAFNKLSNNGSINCFINPEFEKFKKIKGEGLVFEGQLTLGNYSSINVTINAKIYKKNEQFLVIGGVDPAELIEKNKLMMLLNQEVHNLQRQLIKEKSVLESTLKQLELLNLEKNRMLGIAAHDIRSPISAAASFAEILMDKIEIHGVDKSNTYLGYIYKSCMFSLNLLNDLLDVAKIEAGKIDLECTIQNYVETVKDSLVLNEVFAKNKHIDLELHSYEQTIELNYDNTRIEQVLNNLLSNAVKYSMPNTSITLKIEKDENFVYTYVIDQGQGIPANEIEFLFTPFKKTSVKPTGGEKSTGLGLAIARKIIEEHKGSFTVSSKVGKGTTFMYKLPIH